MKALFYLYSYSVYLLLPNNISGKVKPFVVRYLSQHINIIYNINISIFIILFILSICLNVFVD